MQVKLSFLFSSEPQAKHIQPDSCLQPKLKIHINQINARFFTEELLNCCLALSDKISLKFTKRIVHS